MTYSVLVDTFLDSYRNAGIYVKNKYGCKTLDEIIEAMEKEFNLRSRTEKVWKYGQSHDHYFDFKNKNDYLLFLLRWS
jgi:hypothetical protein